MHKFQNSGFKLQNSVYVFDWNILAFQVFVVSCFGQWRMSLHVESMYVQGIKSYVSCARYITVLY